MVLSSPRWHCGALEQSRRLRVTTRIGTQRDPALKAILADPDEVDAFIGEVSISTDDSAPVDQLLRR